ncbi:hypothetical protein [Methylacidimicrobium cyclopophantes]|uniref:hypothetical protein n=1 Tax=Methylacidimicrobium cyclopophantes TaxID=1041766 RepID=UPI00115A259B|nr:hypothetical protein [Methylacidimicrobium cyclopophantes]
MKRLPLGANPVPELRRVRELFATARSDRFEDHRGGFPKDGTTQEVGRAAGGDRLSFPRESPACALGDSSVRFEAKGETKILG